MKSDPGWKRTWKEKPGAGQDNEHLFCCYGLISNHREELLWRRDNGRTAEHNTVCIAKHILSKENSIWKPSILPP